MEDLFKKLKLNFIETIPKWDDDKYLKSTTLNSYTQFYKFIFNYRSIESSKLSVFTTNYDLFNEFALENNNSPTTTAFVVGELFPIPAEVKIFDNSVVDISTTPQIDFEESVTLLN